MIGRLSGGISARSAFGIVMFVCAVLGLWTGRSGQAQDEALKAVHPLSVLKGDEFIQECRRYIVPPGGYQYGGPPGVPADVLLERLPTLNARERHAALFILGLGPNDYDRAYGILKSLWRSVPTPEERIDILRHLIGISAELKQGELVEEIVSFLEKNWTKMSYWGGVAAWADAGMLSDDQRLRIEKRMTQEIRDGHVQLKMMMDVLRCAKALQISDEDVRLMILAAGIPSAPARTVSIAEETAAIKGLAARTPTPGAFRFLAFLSSSDLRPDVQSEIRKATDILAVTRSRMDMDKLFLAELRPFGSPMTADAWQKLSPEDDASASQSMKHAHVYFTNEARVNVADLVRRLKLAGVEFSPEELRFLDRPGMPKGFVDAFRKDR